MSWPSTSPDVRTPLPRAVNNIADQEESITLRYFNMKAAIYNPRLDKKEAFTMDPRNGYKIVSRTVGSFNGISLKFTAVGIGALEPNPMKLHYAVLRKNHTLKGRVMTSRCTRYTRLVCENGYTLKSIIFIFIASIGCSLTCSGV